MSVLAFVADCGVKNRIKVIESATKDKRTLDVPVIGVMYNFVWTPFCTIYAFFLCLEISYYIVYYRLLKRFLTDWQDVLLPKINSAIKKAGTIRGSLDDAVSKIEKLDKIWLKVKKKYLLKIITIFILTNYVISHVLQCMQWLIFFQNEI